MAVKTKDCHALSPVTTPIGWKCPKAIRQCAIEHATAVPNGCAFDASSRRRIFQTSELMAEGANLANWHAPMLLILTR